MLLVNEIYSAICGESRLSGAPCVLVRLTGCHLRCQWCDSGHSFSEGESLAIAQVLARIQELGLATVLITGGEPLLQTEVLDLMQALVDDGYRVLLETSGTVGNGSLVPLTRVPVGVHRIVDVKAPGSGVAPELIDWEAIATLGVDDEIKIVCRHRDDYTWARDLFRAGQRLPAEVPVAFSPVHGELDPRLLAEWILDDRLDVRFQVQLHKLVWPDQQRGV